MWIGWRAGSALRGLMRFCGVSLLLLLAGCAAGTRQLSLAPSAAGLSPARAIPEAAQAEFWVVDRRVNESQLGFGLEASEGTLAGFMAATMGKVSPGIRVMEGATESGDAVILDALPRYRIEIVRAYLNPIVSSIEGVLVVRCYPPGEDAPPQVFRAQKLKVNWFGSDGELRQLFRLCGEEVAREVMTFYELES